MIVLFGQLMKVTVENTEGGKNVGRKIPKG